MYQRDFFVNSELESIFNLNGFVIIDLLNDEKVCLLRDLYTSYFDKREHGLYVTLNENEVSIITEIHHRIIDIIQGSLEAIFKEFDYTIAHFISKANIDSKEMCLHQDWNVVDESKVQAAHIWCPLQETNMENGGLFVIKKSHRFFNNFRSGSLGIPFIDRNEAINRVLYAPVLKPGQAIVYKQALFHGSFPNQSNKPRLTVLSCIKQKDTDWLYFDKNRHEPNRINVYKMNRTLFLEQLPHLEKGAEVVNKSCDFTILNDHFSTSSITQQLFIQKIQEYANVTNR